MFWRRWLGSEERPRRVREGLRLSPNEERYLLAETLTGRVYAVPSATRIFGAFDLADIRDHIQRICDRHEARRTGFERQPGGGFTKYVEDRATVVIKQLSMPGATREEIREAVNAYCYQPGDFSPATLHRYMWITLAEHEHVFVFALHHATSDGMSQQAFSMELAARSFGGKIEEPPPQYSDYWDWDWSNSDAYRAAEAYWVERMSQVGEAGIWPEDRTGDAGERARQGVSVILTPELVAATQRAAKEIGVTHFSYFYAVYLVLLSRMTGASTVCTTFQSNGRRAMKGSEGAHGVFSNALILATHVDETESIAALSARLRTEVREAIAHEIFPYHHVIRATGVHPRYAINWYPQMARVDVGDLSFEPMRFDENQDDDDLNLRFVTYGEQTELFTFYNPDVFSRERVQAATEQLAALAGELARDVNRPVGEVRSAELATPGALPDPAMPLVSGGGEPIYARFLARAAETPDALAVEQGADRWTYADVEARSRTLAQDLRARDVAAGDRVVILAERGPQLIWSMLAVARLGGVFAVLDSAYPAARLATLLDIAAPKAVVNAGGAALESLVAELAGRRKLPVASADGPMADAAFEGLDAADPDAPAYILFTSGSTGGPKGVAASHGPLSHFVAWQAATFGLTAADRFSLLSGLSHDPLLRDVFTPLSIGATIVIPEGSTIATAGALALWFKRAGVTVSHLTPAMGQVLTAGARAVALPDLRRVFWGADRLVPERCAELRGIAPGARQINFYGATETPQAVGWSDVPDDPNLASAPIGVGAAGAQLLVVDADRRPLGVGEPGEIAVRSNSLSLGYVKGGRIVPDPERGVDAQGTADTYYTGDRGHRVELSEVTAAVLAHPEVRHAIALPMGEGSDRRIAVFAAGVRAGFPTEADLRSFLAARLPAYMLPHSVRLLDDLIWLPNGKPDRQALVLLLQETTVTARSQPGRNSTERALIEAWSQALGGAVVSRNSTFAGLGGDSLSYVQAYLATEEAIGVTPAGWQVMTVAELAAAKQKSDPFWSLIDMPILLRAVAIVLVVVGHFSVARQVGAMRYGGGATSALMLISGFMFGSLPLQEAFARHMGAPVLRAVRNIFLPTAALSVLIWIFRMHGSPPQPYILLFTADLQKYGTAVDLGQELYLWYVHCLLHIFLILYAAILLLKRFDGFRIGPTQFLYGLFAVACLTRFLLPQLIDPGFFPRTALPFSQVYLLPTTHLATVLLGALVATSRTTQARIRLAVVVVVYSALSAWLFGPGQGGLILVGGLLLLGAPRVKVPRFSSGVVFALAGASLWIYLTNMMLRDGLKALGDPLPGLGVPLALVGGVALWTLWNRAVSLGFRFLRRPPPVADATV